MVTMICGHVTIHDTETQSKLGFPDNMSETVLHIPRSNTAASQHFALEGQVSVLAPTGMICQAAYYTFVDTEQKKELQHFAGGHARIYGPTVVRWPPLDLTKEGILYPDINCRPGPR
jgi:hypothetical protein